MVGIRQKTWLASGIIYALFVFWYTDFGGPLSDQEIDTWMVTMEENGSTPESLGYYEEFLRNDSGRQFLMVNALDKNENPPNVQGGQPGENSDQLMARYMEHIFPEFLALASHPVYLGDAVYRAIDISGMEEFEGADEWDQGALFRYRSRRSFMQLISNPELKKKHAFKLAALEKTIAYPTEVSFYPADLRLLVGLILLSLTALLDALVLQRKTIR
jgi:hypothetical protein